jgi:hypothetical protein
VGGAAAEIQGGEFAEGAAEGAAISAALTAAEIAWLGAKVPLTFPKKDLKYEFHSQSNYDGSGLDLQFPKDGSYTVRAGGIAPYVSRLTVYGRNLAVKFSDLDTSGKSTPPCPCRGPEITPYYRNRAFLAHELRHIAQINLLTLPAFLGERALALRFEFSREQRLYLWGGSTVPGARLEPNYGYWGRY